MKNEIVLNGSLSKPIERLSNISFILLCILFIDCALSGGGHWLVIGPFSLRMIVGFLAAATAAPSISYYIRRWIKDPIFIGIGIFLVYLIICACIGYAKNNRMDLWLSDIKGFAWLFLIPVATTVVRTEERLLTIMKCIAAAAVIQALLIVIFNILFITAPRLFEVFYTPIINTQLGYIDKISEVTYRLFLKSSPYIVAGIILIAYFQLKAPKFNWVFAVGTGICVTALLLTFTRSLYGAAFVVLVAAVIFFLIYCRKEWKRILSHIVVAAIVAIALAVIHQIALNCNYAQFAFARTFNINLNANEQQNEGKYLVKTKESDDIRTITMNELNEMIKKSPVFGNGLGAAVSCREDGRVEYFYHDLVNKTGIIGLLLYYSPILYMLFILLRNIIRKEKERAMLNFVWFSALGVFMVATYFNPFMNSSLGIGCYALTIACFRLRSGQVSEGRAKEI